MKPAVLSSKSSKAFTLIEILVVIAVIGIMSALVVSAFTGAAQDTRRVIARQQQLAIQNAVNTWVNAESSKPGVGIIGAKTAYNNAGNSLARLQLVGGNPGGGVEGYLENSTAQHLIDMTTRGGNSNQIRSAALTKTQQWIVLTDWNNGSYPKVNLQN